MADPGQDPRGAPDVGPLWTILDFTPAGPRRRLVPRARIRQPDNDQVSSSLRPGAYVGIK
jgi:predicted dithiol-disulfide oxidoreductase (DUF899 family)